MRLFIAHSRSDDDRYLAWWRDFIGAQVPGADVTLGRDDYAQYFKNAESWNNWALGVANRYDSFVVPVTADGAIGRATGQIIEFALRLGKPVAVFDENGVSRRVLRIARKYDGNAQDWWDVEVSP